MPAFIPLIAACVGAAATVYATEASRGKGPKAPAFGGANQGKEKIETPNMFGDKGGGGGLLGGQSEQKPVASLAGALSGSAQPTGNFGPNAPSNAPSDEINKKWLSRLAGGA
jgi:hypothetical protein